MTAIADPARGEPVGDRPDRRGSDTSPSALRSSPARCLRAGSARGDADTDVVEAFHFVEYGLLTLLFYLAWRPLDDLSVLVLPAAGGIARRHAGRMVSVVRSRRASANCATSSSTRGRRRAGCSSASASIRRRVSRRRSRRGSAMRIGADGRRRDSRARPVLSYRLTWATTCAIRGLACFDRATRRGQLESAAQERSARWRDQPPLAVGPCFARGPVRQRGALAREAPQRGDGGGDVFAAWRENRILETFYAPVLDTATYVSRAGFRWPAEQRVDVERRAPG